MPAGGAELQRSESQLLIYAEELNQAYRELQATYFSTLQALAAAIDARDPYTFGHSQRVSYYTVEIAKLMGLESGAIEVLRRAALLHDIGKIGVPDSTLLKPGPLNAAEWAVMKRHPEIGEQMIAGLKFLAEAAPFIRCHHERWDGRGYPDRLRHDQIPLGARILSVADAFDAMTSTRPYRPALSVEEARAEAERGRHRQFDARVVDAFQDGIRAIEAILRRESARSSAMRSGRAVE
jgi:putative nucleotidyltransferase with HDIG domain